MNTIRWTLIGVCVLPAFVGCGSKLASVHGTVTLDGEPIAGSERKYGTVSFYREDGGGVPAVGIIDGAGQYRLRTGGRSGVEPGAYLVGIAVKRVDPPETPDGMPQATLITPPRYASITQSGFREVVKPGENTFDFALSSNRQ